MSTPEYATLRVCGNCAWIFEKDPYMKFAPHQVGGCPKCGFASLGARSVYGVKAYTYKKTQKPWIKKKMATYYDQLQTEIKEQTHE